MTDSQHTSTPSLGQRIKRPNATLTVDDIRRHNKAIDIVPHSRAVESESLTQTPARAHPSKRPSTDFLELSADMFR